MLVYIETVRTETESLYTNDQLPHFKYLLCHSYFWQSFLLQTVRNLVKELYFSLSLIEDCNEMNEESEKAGLKLNIPKTKIMLSSLITS